MATNISGDTGVSKIQDNIVTTDDIQDNAVHSDKLADNSVSSAKLADNSVSSDKLADNSVSSDKLADSLTLQSITETQTTKSSSFTPNLATEGTVFSCSGTLTITMPTVAAGKSFTIIQATGNTLTWAGTIRWNGGAQPDKGTGRDIYVFYSDGTNWYGMQSGTGFA